MLTSLAGHLDCTTRRLRIAVGLLPAYPTTLVVSVSAFTELINDPPGFCLTTVCRLRDPLIVQDFQHTPSLNFAICGLSTRISKMLCSLRRTDKAVSSTFVFHRLAPVNTIADNRARTTSACAVFSSRDLLTGRLSVFFDLSDSVARVKLDAVARPQSACANYGFR
jgi:hypothetical protein